MAPKTIKKKSSPKRRAALATGSTGTTPRRRSVPSAEEELFAKIFRLSPHPIGITELETGRCLEVNDACLEIFGFRRNEVVGHTTLMLGIWPDPQERVRLIDRLKAEKKVRNLEVSMRMKSGESRQFLISTDLIELDGKPCLLTVGNDITERKKAEEALQQNENRFRTLVSNIPGAVYRCALDEHWTVLYISEAIEEIVGYPAKEFVDNVRTYAGVIHPDDRRYVDEMVRSELRERRPYVIDYRVIHANGAVRWVSEKGQGVFGSDGEVRFLDGAIFDATERKKAEEVLRRAHEELEERVAERTAALRRSNEQLEEEIAERRQAEAALHEGERKYRLLANNVPAYFSYVDTELRYRFLNKRYEKIFDRPLLELTGQLVEDVVGEANFSTIEPHLREAIAGREASFIYPMALPNGDARWMNVHYMPDRDETGLIRGVLALLTDVTAQKHAELALQQSQVVLQEKREELQTLTDKLFAAQDSERQRIARDLHDDFSQRLAAVVLDLAGLERWPPILPELIAQAIQPVREEVERLANDLHNLAYQLHPSSLKHLGLQPAIEDYLHKARERTGLQIMLKIRNLPDAVPVEWCTCLFRILQESLQNVVKHAKATEVVVKLSGSSKGIGLSVIDNGKGFNASDKSAHQKGLGLISMQERLRLLNGFLNVHSRQADGTKVCAWIPFQEKTP